MFRSPAKPTCVCKRHDNLEMIECRTCGIRYHYKCAKLTKRQAEATETWYCFRCQDLNNPKPQKSSTTTSSANLGQISTNILSTVDPTTLQLVFGTEQNPNANIQSDSAPTNTLPVDNQQGGPTSLLDLAIRTSPQTDILTTNASSQLQIHSIVVNAPRNDEPDQTRMASQNTSSPRDQNVSEKPENNQLLQIYEEEEELIRQEQEMIKRKREILQKKRQILEESDVHKKNVNTSDTFNFNEMQKEIQQVRDNPRTNHGPTKNTQPLFTPNVSTHQQNVQQGPQMDTLNSSTIFPFSYQYAARHTLKDLPKFRGNPEDWPIFISAYEVSTAQCGLSDYENMLRLQKSLDGTALKMVKSLLYQPGNVGQVIDTLRTLFGRPEQLLSSQIDQIRREPGPRMDKIETIIRFDTAIRNLVANMVSSGLNGHLNNPLLLQELIQKLPDNMKLQWASHIESQVTVNLETFNSWIHKIAMNACRVIPNLDLSKLDVPSTRRLNFHNQEENRNIKHEWKCFLCEGNCKTLAKCRTFKEQTLSQRWDTLKRLNFCKQCLSRHRSSRCPKPTKCKNGCQRPHHPLMHKETPKEDNSVKNNNESPPKQHEKGNETPKKDDKKGNDSPKSEPEKKDVNLNHSQSNNLMFRYLPVKLISDDQTVEVMAFLDEGSDGTFIEEDLAKSMNLKGPLTDLNIKWTGSNIRVEKNSMKVSTKISGVHNGAREFSITDAQTVRSLDLVTQTLDYPSIKLEYPYLSGLPLVSYYEKKPKILIGLNNWSMAVPLKVREGGVKEPIAAKCRLGWSIFASIKEKCQENPINLHFHTIDTATQSVEELVKNYISIDSLGVTPTESSILLQDAKRAEEIMKRTTKRIGDRFETGLLWKYDKVNLPDSKPMATQRLMSLEKRFDHDPELKKNINDQMTDYLAKKYIRKLSSDELKEKHDNIWYLPIFPVINPKKPGKVRIVWDARATVDGISLNSALLTGPDLLSSLLDILCRFRQHKVAVSGDIREMFHQIKIIPEDQHSQRFLIRYNKDTEPDTFVMQVCTFGAKCSPSIAQYIKNTNAEAFKDNFPRAVEAIVHNHYVDDLLDSFESVSEAICVSQQIKTIHKSAGFDIRNWKSNANDVLKALDENNCASNYTHTLASESACVVVEKVLGMFWNVNEDRLTYSLKYIQDKANILKGLQRPTKRELLSILMSIYDPMGLIGNFLNYFKVLVQQLWKDGTDWNEHISDEQFDKWQQWTKILPDVENIKIRRCFIKNIENYRDANVQIHVFVDASQNMSCAVAYLRVQKGDTIETALLGSKSRVAPIRLETVPRLELIAAVLGARLGAHLSKALSIKVDKVVYWSDSTSVLSWIKYDPRRMKGQFIPYKTAEIQELTDPSVWRHVPSKENVADDGTKWTAPPQFIETSRWYQGPPFLQQTDDTWPENISTKPLPEFVISVHQLIKPIIDVSKYSCYRRLLRSTAYAIRYRDILKAKSKKLPHKKGILTSNELSYAENFLIKTAQQEAYPNEYEILKKKDDPEQPVIESSSPIHGMRPQIDSNGVIRSEGRLKGLKSVPFNVTQPNMLPRRHHITHLIVMEYHTRFHHANKETSSQTCQVGRGMWSYPFRCSTGGEC